MELTAIKLPVRTSYRLQLSFSGCIYEVTSPRYALLCFATHVETRSSPQASILAHFASGRMPIRNPGQTPVTIARYDGCSSHTERPISASRRRLLPAPAVGKYTGTNFLQLQHVRGAGKQPGCRQQASDHQTYQPAEVRIAAIHPLVTFGAKCIDTRCCFAMKIEHAST